MGSTEDYSIETLPRMIKSGIIVVHISSVVGFSV